MTTGELLGVAAAIIIVLSGVVKLMVSKELQRADKVADDLNQHRVHVAANFATRSDLRDTVREQKEQLDRMETKLETRLDQVWTSVEDVRELLTEVLRGQHTTK